MHLSLCQYGKMFADPDTPLLKAVQIVSLFYVQ